MRYNSAMKRDFNVSLLYPFWSYGPETMGTPLLAMGHGGIQAKVQKSTTGFS